MAKGTNTTRFNVGDPDLDQQLGFYAHSVIVDNFTNQYLYLPDADQWVAPGVHGKVITLTGTQVGRATYSTPPGLVQPPVGISNVPQVSTITWIEDSLPASPGAKDPTISSVAQNQVWIADGSFVGSRQTIYPVPLGTVAISIVVTNVSGGATLTLVVKDGAGAILYESAGPPLANKIYTTPFISARDPAGPSNQKVLVGGVGALGSGNFQCEIVAHLIPQIQFPAVLG